MQVIVKPKVINERLLKMNKNQEWLANEINVTPGYLSEVMSTGRSPSGKLRDKIMDILNVVDWDVLFEMKKEIDEASQPMPV